MAGKETQANSPPCTSSVIQKGELSQPSEPITSQQSIREVLPSSLEIAVILNSPTGISSSSGRWMNVQRL